MVWYVSMFAFSKHFRSSILRIIRQRWMKSNKMHVCTQLLSHVWLFVASWNATLTESSVHGIFQARILECVATSYLGDLPDPRLLHTLVQSLSCVWLFVTPWIARWASLSITNSWSLLRLTSIESVMPSNHLILCHPLLASSILPSIRVFSNESVLCIGWPKYWSFSFNISPSNEHSGLISFRMDWLDLPAV